MNTATDNTRLVDDLAAHWTDAALEILKDAGLSHVSVDMELETWRTLRHVLRSELRWQRAFRFSTLVSVTTLMEQVLRKGAIFVARKFTPQAVSAEIETSIGSAVRDRRATALERRLYAEMVREPEMRLAFKPATRTDYFPRLHASGSGR